MDIKELVELLKKHNLCFYHFTDGENIKSIKQHGLISKSYAAKQNITIEKPGGNELSRSVDKRQGLDCYVNLCFANQHPMQYIAEKEGRISNTKFLEIKPEILLISGTKITLDVANKTTTSLLDVSSGSDQIDWEVLVTRTDWKDPAVQERLKKARKCEILIPNIVPITYIRNL